MAQNFGSPVMPKVINGKDGANGKDGKSAYQIEVDAGFVGTIEDWRASLKGDKGDKGDPAPVAPVDPA